MPVAQLSDNEERVLSRPPHYLLNGTEMKNLGISGSLLLMTLLAGFWAWTGASASGRRRRAQAGAPSSGRRDVGDRRNVPNAADHPERGDVPGWVMITLMSAVLVAALLALAGPALETMFNQAMDKVGN
jgi:hypothetical protein